MGLESRVQEYCFSLLLKKVKIYEHDAGMFAYYAELLGNCIHFFFLLPIKAEPLVGKL